MKAFLSYTRTKDVFNTVSELHMHLAQELELVAPGSEIFMDVQHLGAGGGSFPDILAKEVQSADVLIVLISPSWLKSEWCRLEFELFTLQCTKIARVLPLLWVPTPQLKSAGNDQVAACLAKVNYINWTELRHETWTNPELRRQLASLAQRIVEIGGSAELRGEDVPNSHRVTPSAAADVVPHNLFDGELGGTWTSAVATKIKLRGYWHILIRPAAYSPGRIANISHLRPLLQRLSINIRDWDFPYVDMTPGSLDIYQSCIAQEIDWDHFIESWRFCQSGQFSYLGAFCMDWPSLHIKHESECTVIFIEDVVAKYAEALEFAARLSWAIAGSDRIWLQVGAHGLEGRKLASGASPLHNMFLNARTAKSHIGEFVLREEISREQLSAAPEEIAFRWALELFRRFGWEPKYDALKEIRGQFRHTRHTSS